MPFMFVEPDVYKKYREEVLALSQSIQINYQEHLPPEKRRPGLSDKQIGEKLGLDERIVREIRCVGERAYYDVGEWERALEFKEAACAAYAKGGLAATTKKYLKKKKADKGK